MRRTGIERLRAHKGLSWLAALVCLAVLLAAAAAVGAWVQRDAGHNDATPHLSAVDIGFAQDMSTHHEQAVVLVTALPGDISPPVRALARQIEDSQLREIGMMRGWLDLASRAPSENPMAWMHDSSDRARRGHTDTMPGMASSEEIDRLRTLHGRDADMQFLQLMIRHHQGGIEMASYAAHHATADVVRRAATAMVLEQTEEMVSMLGMLHADGGQALPFP